MVKGKIMRAAITIILSTMFITAFLNLYYAGNFLIDFFTNFFGLLLWVAPIILIYGVPITILSDFITKRLTGIKRMLSTLIIYLSFGIVFGLLLPSNIDITINGGRLDLFIIAGGSTAFIFWVVEEYSMCMHRRNSSKSSLLN